jgi:site-specific recombinase XerD
MAAGKRDHGDGGLDQLGPDRWRLRWRIGPKRFSKVHHGSKQSAQRELRRLISTEAAPDKSLTVAKFFQAWLENDRDLSPKTRERYAQLLQNQLAPHLGSIPLADLRPVQVKGWLDTLATSPGKRGFMLSAESVAHARRLLSNGLARAVRLELVNRNVAAVVKAPKVDKPEVEILSDVEVAEVLQRLQGHELTRSR